MTWRSVGAALVGVAAWLVGSVAMAMWALPSALQRGVGAANRYVGEAGVTDCNAGGNAVGVCLGGLVVGLAEMSASWRVWLVLAGMLMGLAAVGASRRRAAPGV